MRTSLSNCLLGYYLVLIQISQASKEHGKKWPQHFLPIQRRRNFLDLIGHFVQASRFWEANLPWVPSSREESRIEGFFGQVKHHARGSPTVKDCLYGMHYVHAKQLQASNHLQATIDLCEETVTDAELQLIAMEALENACEFHSWISVDTSIQDIKNEVEAWSEAGQSFIKRRFWQGLGC